MHRDSPNSNREIPSPYSAETLVCKQQNKLALQEELGWPPEEKRAMLCLPTEMSEGRGGALLKAVLPGLLELPIELLILGKGTAEFGKIFSRLREQESHRITIIENSADAISRMYAAADMALFCSAAEETEELRLCLRHGVIPIAPALDMLENYNPNQERGCAFLYESPSPWQCFAALVRALETYRFPFDWRAIQKEAMRNSIRKTTDADASCDL